jgi:hypothetical protein
MKSLKHVGKMKKAGSKVLVAFRTLPGESNQALVIPVSSLSDNYHDDIMKLVETTEAQSAFEFGEVLFTRSFSDGRPMLQALKADNRMAKVPTDDVLMMPSPGSEIALHQLNTLIAEQKNCAVDDLCTFVSGSKKNTPEVQELVKVKDLAPPPTPAVVPLKAAANEVLSDKDIAKSYRSQADSMYKEAARLRKEADDLDPPAKKAAKAKEDASA